MMKLAHVHLRAHKLEPAWHVNAALLVAIGLQFVLTTNLTIGPKYLIAGLELAVLAALALINPHGKRGIIKFRHLLATMLIVFISAANIISLVLVVHSLFGGTTSTGRELILSGLTIYLTNIIIFGLWYWELDSNGVNGQSTNVLPADFLFPQMTPGDHKLPPGAWVPTFFDYLYISVGNGTSFSPSDAPPLTHRAKLLMTVQALTSLLTIALVAARAVNILS
jgi:hypothetical protein